MARILLPNNCQRTLFNVTPKNWKTASASVKKLWHITYRFIDPAFKDHFPNGMQLMVRGMNKYADLKERQGSTKGILAELEKMLAEGYNPITAQFNEQAPDNEYIIAPSTPVVEALRAAATRRKVTRDVEKAIGYTIDAFAVGVKATNREKVSIKDFSRRYVLAALDAAEAQKKGGWSPYTFNRHRTHLLGLWKELVKVEAVDINPIRDTEPRRVIKRIRETLTPEQRRAVNTFLLDHYPVFWRFLHIFFHSGARESELMRLKGKDVNLKRQEIKCLVLKGTDRSEKIRPIKDIALPLWEAAMAGCDPEDYVFSKGLLPGPTELDPVQISRRWEAHVKGKKPGNGPRLDVKVTADFYSLKHSNLDELTELLSMEEAAKAAGHTSIDMMKEHYAVGQKKREFEQIRKAGNKFA